MMWAHPHNSTHCSASLCNIQDYVETQPTCVDFSFNYYILFGNTRVTKGQRVKDWTSRPQGSLCPGQAVPHLRIHLQSLLSSSLSASAASWHHHLHRLHHRNRASSCKTINQTGVRGDNLQHVLCVVGCTRDHAFA